MNKIAIHVDFDGEWVEEGELDRWIRRGKGPISIVVDISITLEGLVEKLYKKLRLERHNVKLKLSYMPSTCLRDISPPIFIGDDEDMNAYLMDTGEKGARGMLWVQRTFIDDSPRGLPE